MAYYLNLFSPETYEAFSRSARELCGFRLRHKKAAQRVEVGDRFLCYMTKLSRWIGILEAKSGCFEDDSPLLYEAKDPFVLRFRVAALVWLPKERCIPIHDDQVWEKLSFTRGHEKNSSLWTGSIRTTLVRIEDADARVIEAVLQAQQDDGRTYEVDETQYRRLLGQRVRRPGGEVPVVVPENEEADEKDAHPVLAPRESTEIQARIAGIGETMGFKIWLPRNDRSRVLQHWTQSKDSLLETLPLNYDEATLSTIENIDVLWLRGRSIVRAFEVEHSTSVYSGILRMADLLALQPNMDIKLHIVAPAERREKVFQEIRRPVFSLLEKGALAQYCTFISYDGVRELAQHEHLSHLSDSVLAEYEEGAEWGAWNSATWSERMTLLK